MTLCIAALCESDTGPAVVTSADTQIETDEAGAEIGWKYVDLSLNWTAMIAGKVSEAHELCMHYRRVLMREQAYMTEDNATEILHEPLNAYRAQLVERQVQRRLAMSYAKFVKLREKALDDALYSEIAWQVSRIEIPAYLILIGWSGDRFLLYIVDGYYGTVTREQDFAAIGSGAPIATANLYQRKQMLPHTLNTTLYNVYESHRLATIAPGVGLSNIMRVMEYTPGTSRAITYLLPAERAVYDGYFAKYGPRDASDALIPADLSRRLLRTWERKNREDGLRATTEAKTETD